jgi:hypothetical protein
VWAGGLEQEKTTALADIFGRHLEPSTALGYGRRVV